MYCSGKLSKEYDPGKKLTGDKSVFMVWKESPCVNISAEPYLFKQTERLGGLLIMVTRGDRQRSSRLRRTDNVYIQKLVPHGWPYFLCFVSIFQWEKKHKKTQITKCERYHLRKSLILDITLILCTLFLANLINYMWPFASWHKLYNL